MQVYDYNDPTDQTSCTAWNYYASATSNAAAQAAVAMRNFSAAYETGYFPIIHCATSDVAVRAESSQGSAASVVRARSQPRPRAAPAAIAARRRASRGPVRDTRRAVRCSPPNFHWYQP